MRLRKLTLEKAIGQPLAHDLTRIIPGKLKETAFKRGQVITENDLEILRDMGRNSLYVMQLNGHEVHENDAAEELTRLVAGPGLTTTPASEGKVNLLAEATGLFKVNVRPTGRFNSIPPLALSTLHTNSVVEAGQLVASVKVVPLAVRRTYLERVEKLTAKAGPLVSAKPFLPLKVGAVITGSEIVTGRIENGFGRMVAPRITRFGAKIIDETVVGDSPTEIAATINNQVEAGAEMVVVTGGLSVDPDDRTRQGVRRAGARQVFYGSPVLPGAMVLYARLGEIPILGLPACVFYNHRTVFDLVLPRFLAGESPTRAEISGLGHGGLCQLCESCSFPHCPFGKGGI